MFQEVALQIDMSRIAAHTGQNSTLVGEVSCVRLDHSVVQLPRPTKSANDRQANPRNHALLKLQSFPLLAEPQVDTNDRENP